jgi:zinc protease
MKKTEIKYSIILTAVLFILPYFCFAQSQIQEFRLDNGLVLLMQEDHSSPLVAIQVYFHVGSKNEMPGLTGINALCAKLYQKGTPHYPAGEYSRIIQGGGGATLAANDLDLTYFGAKVSSSQLDTVLFLEADRMQNVEPAYEKLLLARDEIFRERLTYIDNQLYGPLNEELFSLAYRSHPYSHPIYGWPVDLVNVTFEEFRAFFRQYYQPSNAAIIVVGDFNTEQLKKKVKLLFEKIISSPVPTPKKIIEPEQRGERKEILLISSQIPLVLIGYHIPAISDRDIYPVRMLYRALCLGTTGRLYRRLVMTEKSSLDINGAMVELEDPGLVVFYSSMNYGKSATLGEQQILEEIERLKTEPLSPAELEKLKNRTEVDYYRATQSAEQRASRIGYYYFTAGNLRLMNNEVEMARGVTAEEIIKAANKYLISSNRSVITLQPRIDSDLDKGSKLK